MPAFRELLDELRAELREVVRLTTGDETVLGVHDLVDPGTAGVADVGLEAGPRADLPPAYHVRLDEQPRTVADRADRLAGLDQRLDERHRPRVCPQVVGVCYAAGQDQPVVVVRVR